MNCPGKLLICDSVSDKVYVYCRALDNFFKQGVADASLGSNGIFLQNAVIFFFTPNFQHRSIFLSNKFRYREKKNCCSQLHTVFRHHFNIHYCYAVIMYLCDRDYREATISFTRKILLSTSCSCKRKSWIDHNIIFMGSVCMRVA